MRLEVCTRLLDLAGRRAVMEWALENLKDARIFWGGWRIPLGIGTERLVDHEEWGLHWEASIVFSVSSREDAMKLRLVWS